MKSLQTALRDSWQVVRDDWRAYVTLNLLYYGLVLAGMAFVFANPQVQEALLESVGQDLQPGGSMAGVAAAYDSGNVIVAAAVTFGVNLVLGSFLGITLPSLVIPVFGVALGLFRAILWGLLLAPQGSLTYIMIPHSVTLLLEGQGYIIAMLGTFTIAKGLFRPEAYGATSYLGGYLAGIRRCARLYVLGIAILAVAAIYEAIEVLLMMNLLPPG
jgi:hypothetical protein